MNEHESLGGDKPSEEVATMKEAGQRLGRTFAWLAVAAVAVLVITLCVVALYAMGIF